MSNTRKNMGTEEGSTKYISTVINSACQPANQNITRPKQKIGNIISGQGAKVVQKSGGQAHQEIDYVEAKKGTADIKQLSNGGDQSIGTVKSNDTPTITQDNDLSAAAVSFKHG